jgi:hypothetical protein
MGNLTPGEKAGAIFLGILLSPFILIQRVFVSIFGSKSEDQENHENNEK